MWVWETQESGDLAVRFMLVPFSKMEKSRSGSDVEPLVANKLHLLLVLFLLQNQLSSLLVIPRSKQMSSNILPIISNAVSTSLALQRLAPLGYVSCWVWPIRENGWKSEDKNENQHASLRPSAKVASLVESRTEPIGSWTLFRVQEVQEDPEKKD